MITAPHTVPTRLPAALLILMLMMVMMLLGRPVHASDQALLQDMDALRKREQLAGLVWGWFDGSRSGLGASGFADQPRSAPMTAQARVQVGSVAKTVTALAVLRLVSQGRLELDAPLATLLPDVPLHNPWAASHPLRLRHLLDMNGGLRDLRLHHVFSRRHAADTPLAADLLNDDPGLLSLRTPPGEQFSYSNLGFLLLGMVIERTVGERYEAWTDRELLAPLGMTHSTTHGPVGLPLLMPQTVPLSMPMTTPATPIATPTPPAIAPPGTALPPLAMGHLGDFSRVPPQRFGMRPAGQLTTTAADLLRLLRFIASDGRIGGRSFINAELLRAMGRPAGTAAARAGVAAGYGLGLFTRDRHGTVGLCHGGSTAGWRAMVCLFPADRPEAARGFALAINSDREGADHGALDARLVQHLGLQRPAPSIAARPPRADDAAWTGLYVADPPRLDLMALPERLFGVWWLRIGADGATLREGVFGPPRQLSAEESVLRLTVQSAVPSADPPGLYRQADRQLPTLALLRDANGQPRLASGMLGLRRISLAEWAATWAVVAAGAAGYLFTLVGLPWRCHVAGRRAAQPATVAAWGLLAAGMVAATRPWQQLAEPSTANGALAVLSLLLPAAAVWQLARAGRAWRLEAAAALALLLLCITLVVYGLLPVAPWRW